MGRKSSTMCKDSNLGMNQHACSLPRPQGSLSLSQHPGFDNIDLHNYKTNVFKELLLLQLNFQLDPEIF